MSLISDVCGGGDTDRTLVPGSLRGYRTWHLLGRRAAEERPDSTLPLTSVTRPGIRWPRTLAARCVPAIVTPLGPGSSPATPELDHPAPQTGCVCGIYAWYDPVDTYMLNARIFGVVEASGLVVMGERGLRAERATVAAVVTRSRWATAVCESAGVAVYRRQRHLLRDYPPQDMSPLLGDPPPSPPRVAGSSNPRAGLLLRGIGFPRSWG
jgi:hypothetical protein